MQSDICWSSAAGSPTGVRVDTIASCLLLADHVQEFINVATVLLGAVFVTMLPLRPERHQQGSFRPIVSCGVSGGGMDVANGILDRRDHSGNGI
jgi:hypothetical protein